MDANTQLDEQVMAHDWNLFSKDPTDANPLKRDLYRLAFCRPRVSAAAKPAPSAFSSRCSSPIWN